MDGEGEICEKEKNPLAKMNLGIKVSVIHLDSYWDWIGCYVAAEKQIK